MQVIMLVYLNEDQRKLAAKTMADAAKLTYLGSAASGFFGEAVSPHFAALGFIIATLLAWAAMDMLR